MCSSTVVWLVIDNPWLYSYRIKPRVWPAWFEWHDDAVIICEWNPLVTVGFPSQRFIDAGLWCFFVVSLNKLFNKESHRRQYETPGRSYNATVISSTSGHWYIDVSLNGLTMFKQNFSTLRPMQTAVIFRRQGAFFNPIFNGNCCNLIYISLNIVLMVISTISQHWLR